MSEKIIKVNRGYKFRLYHNAEANRQLHDTINVSGIIWNHITALRKRYYRRFGKHLDSNRLQKHLSKLRMKTQRFAYWQMVGSQAVQDICQRHDKAYQRFFNKEGGRPRFKKVKNYTSFTLKQAGWKLGEDTHQRGSKKHPKWTGHIEILGHPYKFVKHRPMQGEVKTVTIKRDAAGRLWVCFSVVEKIELPDQVSTSKIGGFDFGLTTFLTTEQGDCIDAPEFLKSDLPRLRQIQRQISKKVQDSTNQREGKRHLARRHIRVADKRRDFHFKLAHRLCQEYDVLVFEDLNIDGMKRLWGRKVSDLGFAQFLDIIEWMAMKHGKRVVIIDRWERTTGRCSRCGHCQKLDLKDRTFCCEQCHFSLGRDHNAAINIGEAGHRLILSQSEKDLVKSKASGVHGRSPSL
ncbi:MAG: transposase [bacterium]|nr:transposase [bacterium]